jgi:predicted nucleotidyltransferase
MNHSALSSLGETTLGRLRELESSLVKTMGDGLVSLLVYGSAARGGYREGQSDIDVLVVVREASRPMLLAIANALQTARYSARIETMILVEGEIASSADVFPLLYDDIRRHRVILHGADPFATLRVDDRHRRIRIEQELRDARTRLRRAVIDGLGAKEALARTLRRKTKQVRLALYALLRARGVDCEDRTQTVLEAAGRLYGVDTSPITRSGDTPELAYDALVQLLGAAIDDVDAMEGA